ncbi:general transcription factor IIF subunit 1-like isoform X1 [Asterias rubens]|uniref:general transcription factor IIF subunit 1-like isoform X1 n=1 Tax=Asterias rubens TaxID=7604 RepID=UPI001455D58B|nr:general transcription factor IIF subunit 1-like isoform X1 [Asterias rubens]
MSLKAGFSKGPSRPSSSTMGPAEPAKCIVKLQTKQSRKYSIMQFNRGDNVDLSKWKQAKMERENNMREFKMLNPDMPTHGAGSEFGREVREEARRKKYGVVAKKYKEENQPWILKQLGNPGKKFKGKKEGLISENSNYYIFKKQADGTFEASPVDSWYSFTSVAKHKTLTAEEAEEEFGRRDRTFNFFTLMVEKRMKESAGEELSKEDEEELKAKTKTRKKKVDLRITEDDDYQDLMTSEESDAYNSDDDEPAAKSKSKKKGAKKRKSKKKKQDSDDEGEEESDEGDFEGKELDYISEDSSDEEEEQKKIDIMGLDEELHKIEEEEEEEEEEDKEKEEEKKDEMNRGKTEEKVKKEGESSSSSSDSDDSDIDDNKIHSAMLMQQKKPSKRPATPPSQKTPSKTSSRSASRPETPTQNANTNSTATSSTLSDAANKLQDRVSLKRPGTDEAHSSKRHKTEESASASRIAGKETVGLTEDVIRRYLMRKPMTTKDLLYKLKSKKIGLKSDVLVKQFTEIIRKLNPQQTKIKGKTYWFIKQ